ncbi:hypothetical protein BDV39DRAFT_210968 [Aspergillus sergii]|uniref:Uncharacterized protein n=1 Tax=Aspergillus sergii TaxID=1034303 RepID=A0A5N6WKR2_9EURO|nr:hypothetical protein BDV39DRAFT_210968 [Aspergillus sergii]
MKARGLIIVTSSALPSLNSETADTVFATRFRQIISDPHAPQPSHLLRLDYANDKVLMTLVESTVPWPSHSRARFLVEAGLKYISHCHYIVPRDVTREGLAQVFLNPAPASSGPSSPWGSCT